MTHIVNTDEGPRSSCCGATLMVEKTYTDIHVYEITEVETDESGNVVAGSYRFRKTHDGIDGTDFRITCDNCDGEVLDDIDWNED